MFNEPKILPNAPPPLYLSPPLIPLAVSSPTIHYNYVISKRTFFCYNHLFSLMKKPNKWKLSMALENNAYEIPLTKNKDDITLILMSVGIENALFKVEVFSKDIKVNTKYFITINSLVNYIIENEKVIEDVVFC
tara:strand:+ start:55 stop:456 length:402 start_codon:yes stop_codon:yes gene_type:complete